MKSHLNYGSSATEEWDQKRGLSNENAGVSFMNCDVMEK